MQDIYIPKEIIFIIEKLKKEGFKAYIVGGCVRDLFRREKPIDWDCATDALPEKILEIFPNSFYKNKFGTVTVIFPNEEFKEISEIKEIEITTFRIDEKYSDKRHPDKIRFAKTIEEDLSRRDFTINAIALERQNAKRKMKNDRLRFKDFNLIDPYQGQKDLKDKIIRTVGFPEDRFSEDALRMLRAIRFAVSLDGNFRIEEKTFKAIKKNAFWIQAISKERIRDEFIKIIESERAAQGIELLRKTTLLKYIIPELEEGYKISQNKHHIYDCYTHLLLSLKYAALKNFNKCVRIASLFHDIAKPRAKKGEGPDATFYGHEILGTKMAIGILSRLKFPKEDIEKIAKLIRYHLFYYNVGEVKEASIRKLLRNVGSENIEELIQVRIADRIGSGVPKAEPYKLRHFRYLIEKVSQDPISVKMLKIKGNDIMEILKIPPGPKIGEILEILLKEVLENPKKNREEYLKQRVRELGELLDKDIKAIAEEAKKEKGKIEIKRDEMTKKKYWVT